ncbi:MAG: hypothetical protein WCH46_07520 [bacterium]
MKIIFFLLASCSLAFAQSHLTPTIGLPVCPADSERICTIVCKDFSNSDPSTDNLGPKIGLGAPDFTLYNVNGLPTTLSTVLKKKPVLLFAGSYTCYVFRQAIPIINRMVKRYGDSIAVYMIYNYEAHPIDTLSPFIPEDNAQPELNIKEGVLFTQTRTYGERRNMAIRMTNEYKPEVNVPILIDVPCNTWINTFGPAPNNSFLIDTSGLVVSKRAWFVQDTLGTMKSIESLIRNKPSTDSTTNPNPNDTGKVRVSFVTEYISDTVAHLVDFSGEIRNNTSKAISVTVTKKPSLPGEWVSSMCLDNCFTSAIDTASVLIPAYTTQPIFVHISSDSTAGSGTVPLQFANSEGSIIPKEIILACKLIRDSTRITTTAGDTSSTTDTITHHDTTTIHTVIDSGRFTVVFQGSRNISAKPNTTLHYTGSIVNGSNTKVKVAIQKTESLPSRWVPTYTISGVTMTKDTLSLTLLPKASRQISISVQTSEISDSGIMKLSFSGFFEDNKYELNLSGKTVSEVVNAVHPPLSETIRIVGHFNSYTLMPPQAHSRILITDILGKLVAESVTESFDLSNKPSGVYFVHILSGDTRTMQTLKVLKY